MHRGYVKVWRKIADAGWLQNHKLCALWLWCLIKASHKEYEMIVGCQTVRLMPGDFVFGLKAASKETKLSIQSIRTLLDFLKTSQNLTIKSTNKYSIISITNWNTYQAEENDINTLDNKPLTNQQQTTNNKQTQETHKHIKKNKTLCVYSNAFESFWDEYPKHTSKKTAFKEFESSPNKPPVDAILEALRAQKRNKAELHAAGQFCPEWPDPERWLKKERWNDELVKITAKSGGNGNGSSKSFATNRGNYGANRELPREVRDAADAINREYEATKASTALRNILNAGRDHGVDNVTGREKGDG